MPKLLDLTNHKYGKLTVIKRTRIDQREKYWLCICECGNEVETYTRILRSGLKKSCGCLVKEVSSKNIKKAHEHNKKHEMTGTRFHSIWINMKHRCYYSKSPYFVDYGGRGIEVCGRWHNFLNFKEDMYKAYQEHVENHGERNTTLERVNVNGNYEPENCIWTTNSRQGRNKRITVKYKYKGKEYSLYDLADLADINPGTLESRLRRGWSIEKAVETPVDRKMRNSKAKAITAEGGNQSA